MRNDADVASVAFSAHHPEPRRWVCILCTPTSTATAAEGAKEHGGADANQGEKRDQPRDIVRRFVELQSVDEGAETRLSLVLREVEKLNELFRAVDCSDETPKNDYHELDSEESQATLRRHPYKETATPLGVVIAIHALQRQMVLEPALATISQCARVIPDSAPMVEAVAVDPLRGTLAKARLDKLAATLEADTTNSTPVSDGGGGDYRRRRCCGHPPLSSLWRYQKVDARYLASREKDQAFLEIFNNGSGRSVRFQTVRPSGTA